MIAEKNAFNSSKTRLVNSLYHMMRSLLACHYRDEKLTNTKKNKKIQQPNEGNGDDMRNPNTVNCVLCDDSSGYI